MYAGRTTAKFLWEIFNIVVNLDKIYRKQGDDPRQASFRSLLTNIRNVELVLEYLDLLMNLVDTCMYQKEKIKFDSYIHLFGMNNLFNCHNPKMIKSLNFPIARCVVECSRRT